MEWRTEVNHHRFKDVRLAMVCELIIDGTHQTPTYCDVDEGVMFLSSKDVTTGYIAWDDVKYIPHELHKILSKRVSPKINDVLLAKNGTTGIAALVEEDCVFDIYVSLALLRPRKTVLPRYLVHAINSPYCKTQFDASLKGMGVPNLHLIEIKKTKIPLPSLAEQSAIAAYIDRRTAEIDDLLADLRNQAGMLERYKRELIVKTVTKGRDKAALTKDSGVEYLGAIPETWELLPLFAVVTENNVKNDGMVCDNLLSLSYGRIITKDIDTNFGLLPASFEGYQIVHAGYTVLRLTDLQNDKRSLRTGYVTETGIITSAYMGLIPGERFNSKYFSYLLHAYDLLKIYYGLGSGLRQTLKFSDMKRLPVLIPPMPEQEAIVAYIDTKTSQVNGLIADINEQIEKLKQYRQIVIHDAVMGKNQGYGGIGNGYRSERAKL